MKQLIMTVNDPNLPAVVKNCELINGSLLAKENAVIQNVKFETK